jgi:hypothetical protein
MSLGVEDGRRPPTPEVRHPRKGHKAVSGVVRPEGLEGSGMAGPGKNFRESMATPRLTSLVFTYSVAVTATPTVRQTIIINNITN